MSEEALTYSKLITLLRKRSEKWDKIYRDSKGLDENAEGRKEAYDDIIELLELFESSPKFIIISCEDLRKGDIILTDRNAPNEFSSSLDDTSNKIEATIFSIFKISPSTLEIELRVGIRDACIKILVTTALTYANGPVHLG